MPKGSSFSSKFKSFFSSSSKTSSPPEPDVSNTAPEPSTFKPTPERLLLLTGNHNADYQAAYSLYSMCCKNSESYDRKLDSVQPDSAEEEKSIRSYTSALMLELEAGLLVNAIAPKAYGQPDPSRVLNSDELRRAQALVDALCRKFVSYYDLSMQADSIRDIPSKKDELQQLEDSKKKTLSDIESLTVNLTKIYWPVPPAVLVDVDDPDEELAELEDLREKVKKLELENKTLSTLNRNDFAKNSRLQKQIISYRQALEERDATISVLEKRLENFASSESPLLSDGDQMNALKQQLLDRDVQLEQLQKRYDELDEDYARDLDKVRFVDDLLVFLEKDKKLYHCYGCSQFKEPFDYKDTFVCCDRKTARALGYTECDFCCNFNSELYAED